MRASEFLANKIIQVIIKVMMMTMLISAILIGIVGYYIDSSNLKKSLSEISKVVSTLIFQNDQDLLVRNINFYVEDKELTQLSLPGHYHVKEQRFGAWERCLEDNVEGVFTLKVCKKLITKESFASIAVLYLTLMVTSLFLYFYQRRKTREVLEVLSTEIEGIFLPQVTNFYSRFEEIERLNRIHKNNKELREIHNKNKAIIELARKVTHDLRSPLTLLNQVKSNSAQSEFLNEAVDRIQVICDDLLNKTRKGQVPNMTSANHRRFSLSQLLEKLKSSKLKEYTDVALHLNFSTEMIIWGNENDFYRIFSNLINNSIEARSGVGEIEINISTPGENIILVKDNCGGASDPVLNGLGRVEYSSKGDKGNGIGLVTCRETVESLGGDVRFYNNSRPGMTVEIILPTSHILKESSPIVLIDDDKYILTDWANKAKEKVLNFKGFNSVESFMKEIDSFTEDAEFFIDVEIGADSGVALTRELKSRGYRKVNLCTSHDPSHFEGEIGLNSIIDKNFPSYF